VSYADPETAGFSIGVEDFNGNAVSYTLDLTARVSGSTLFAEDVVTITSFPNTLTINMVDVAAALGIGTDEINFGDNFSFIATVVNTDGEEFVGILPDLGDDLLPEGGNTNDPLLTTSYYNGAMNFNFTLACPAFVTEDVVGTYDVLSLGFGGFFGEVNFVRTIVAGPGDNTVTIQEGEYTVTGADPLEVSFDPATGSVTGVNTDGFVFSLSGTDNFYLLVDGLVLPCAGNGIIDLRMNFNPFSGNPHDFIMEKQ
jgi:hypothetical protein